MIRFEYSNVVPHEMLKEIWQTYFPSQPFPNVIAYQVTTPQLVDFIETLRSESNYIDTRIVEYGKWKADDELCAFTAYNVNRNAFIILRRVDSPSSLDTDLRHELLHVHDQLDNVREPHIFTSTSRLSNGLIERR